MCNKFWWLQINCFKNFKRILFIHQNYLILKRKGKKFQNLLLNIKPIRVVKKMSYIVIKPYGKIKHFTFSVWMTYLRFTIEVCFPKLNHLCGLTRALNVFADSLSPNRLTFLWIISNKPTLNKLLFNFLSSS